MQRPAIILFMFFGQLFAQMEEQTATTFRLFAEVSGGYVYTTTAPKLPMGDITRDGIAAALRLKWGSSNLLGVGLETGWLPISSMRGSAIPTEFGAANIEASRSAVPLLVLFSIQRLGVQLHTGAGYYHVRSVVIMQGERMESSEWDLGYVLSAGFGRPVTDAVRLGAEVKVYGIVEQQVSMLSFQMRAMVRLFGE